MSYIVTGLYSDSKAAGSAIAELKQKGYAKEISLITKDLTTKQNVKSHTVKEDTTDGAVGGAAIGAALGALTALLVGATNFIVPGVGLLITGPLAVGLSGAAAGALTGGIVGALVDKGIPDDKAKLFQDRVQHGDVLVAITTDDAKTGEVSNILNKHDAEEVTTGNKDIT